jgi:hypothetical protein
MADDPSGLSVPEDAGYGEWTFEQAIKALTDEGVDLHSILKGSLLSFDTPSGSVKDASSDAGTEYISYNAWDKFYYRVAVNQALLDDWATAISTYDEMMPDVARGKRGSMDQQSLVDLQTAINGFATWTGDTADSMNNWAGRLDSDETGFRGKAAYLIQWRVQTNGDGLTDTHEQVTTRHGRALADIVGDAATELKNFNQSMSKFWDIASPDMRTLPGLLLRETITKVYNHLIAKGLQVGVGGYQLDLINETQGKAAVEQYINDSLAAYPDGDLKSAATWKKINDDILNSVLSEVKQLDAQAQPAMQKLADKYNLASSALVALTDPPTKTAPQPNLTDPNGQSGNQTITVTTDPPPDGGGGGPNVDGNPGGDGGPNVDGNPGGDGGGPNVDGNPGGDGGGPNVDGNPGGGGNDPNVTDAPGGSTSGVPSLTDSPDGSTSGVPNLTDSPGGGGNGDLGSNGTPGGGDLGTNGANGGDPANGGAFAPALATPPVGGAGGGLGGGLGGGGTTGTGDDTAAPGADGAFDENTDGGGGVIAPPPDGGAADSQLPPGADSSATSLPPGGGAPGDDANGDGGQGVAASAVPANGGGSLPSLGDTGGAGGGGGATAGFGATPPDGGGAVPPLGGADGNPADGGAGGLPSLGGTPANGGGSVSPPGGAGGVGGTPPGGGGSVPSLGGGGGGGLPANGGAGGLGSPGADSHLPGGFGADPGSGFGNGAGASLGPGGGAGGGAGGLGGGLGGLGGLGRGGAGGGAGGFGGGLGGAGGGLGGAGLGAGGGAGGSGLSGLPMTGSGGTPGANGASPDSGGSPGGVPFFPPMMGGAGGAAAGQPQERERQTWLSEDEDVWGTRVDVGSGVVGRLDEEEDELEELPMDAPSRRPRADGPRRPRPGRPEREAAATAEEASGSA